MFPYYLLFGTFALGAFGEGGQAARSRNAILFFAAAVLVAVMIGLRYHVGVDWANYLTIWTYAGELDLHGLTSAYHGDPVFYALVWFLKNNGFSYWVLNLLCAVFFTWGLFSFANRQPNRWLAVAVAVPYLVIVIAMSGLRQATAIGFVFLALVAFFDRSPLRFVLYIACGAAFHASAIMIVPLAAMSFTRNRFQSVLLLALAVVAGYFFLGGSFAEYANDYVTNQARTSQSSGTLYRIAMNIVPAIVFFRYGKYIALDSRDRLLWRNFVLLAFASLPLFAITPSSTALDRVLLYLYPLQMFVLSRVPTLFAGTRRGLYFMLTGLLLLYLVGIMIIFLNFGVNSAAYIPYRFYPFEGETVDSY